MYSEERTSCNWLERFKNASKSCREGGTEWAQQTDQRNVGWISDSKVFVGYSESKAQAISFSRAKDLVPLLGGCGWRTREPQADGPTIYDATIE